MQFELKPLLWKHLLTQQSTSKQLELLQLLTYIIWLAGQM